MNREDPSSEQQTLTLQQALDLAVQHHTAGDLSKAEGIYQQILETDPDYPDALHLLGVVSHQKGEDDRAVDLITKALAIQPDFAEAHSNLGLTLKELGRLDEAVISYHKAIDIKPDYAEAHFNLGNAFEGLGRLNEAVASYHQALDINPDYAKALNNLGNVRYELGDFDEAMTSYRKAISIRPDFSEVYSNLGLVFQGLGKLDKAVANFREALSFKPNHTQAGRNLLFAILYVPGLSPDELFTEHLRFSENHASGIPQPAEDFINNPNPDRRLRVGYLSSDFRDHPVGCNILPLLTSHDRVKFKVYCYANVRRPDAITEKFRTCVDHWYSIVGKSDTEVARMVRDDKIDVLVCLAGRFDNNRPLVCAHRAAPVQVSYHDGATSGLQEMDYWLTDNFLHPPDTKEMFTEELHRLPVFYQYPPVEEAPPISALPAEKVGVITFGSFNNPAKVNDEVIGLWAEVLKSVPGSQLLLKYKNWYAQASLRGSVVERFAACEIGQDRIIFAVNLDTIKEHLGRYGEVDIALDPFPFNGTATTFEALWMGVPVVSLAGKTFMSRATGSILNSGGLGELVVDTPEAYVTCARDLAGDLARLGTYRTILRERIATSPLCDSPTYASTVETAYRDMWRKWCVQHKNGS